MKCYLLILASFLVSSGIAFAQTSTEIDEIYQWVELGFETGELEPRSLDGFVLDDPGNRVLDSPEELLFVRPGIERHAGQLLRVYPQVMIHTGERRFLRVSDVYLNEVRVQADMRNAGPNAFSFLVYLPNNTEIGDEVIGLLNHGGSNENAQIYVPSGTFGDAVEQRFQRLHDGDIAEVPLGCFALIFQALDSDPETDENPTQRIPTGSCSHPSLPDMEAEYQPDINDTTGPFWVSSADAVNEVGEPMFDFDPVPILILQPDQATMGDAVTQYVDGSDDTTGSNGGDTVAEYVYTTPEDELPVRIQTELPHQEWPSDQPIQLGPIAPLPEEGNDEPVQDTSDTETVNVFLAGFDALSLSSSEQWSGSRVTDVLAPCGNQAVAYVVPEGEAIAQNYEVREQYGEMSEAVSAGLQSLQDGTAEGRFQVLLEGSSGVVAEVDLSLYQGDLGGGYPALVVVLPQRGSSPQTIRQATLWLPTGVSIEDARVSGEDSELTVAEGACAAQDPPNPYGGLGYRPYCLTGQLEDGGHVAITYNADWIQEPHTELNSINGDEIVCSGFGDTTSGVLLNPVLSPRERDLRVQISGVMPTDIPELEDALTVELAFPPSGVGVNVSLAEIATNQQGGVELRIRYEVNEDSLQRLLALPSFVSADYAIEVGLSDESSFIVEEPAVFSLPPPTSDYQDTYDIGGMELSRRNVTLPTTFNLVTLLPRPNGTGAVQVRNFFCDAALVSDSREGDIRLEFVGDSGTLAQISAESSHLATEIPPETEFRLFTFPNALAAATRDRSEVEAICGGARADAGYRYSAVELTTTESLVLPFARPLIVYVLRSQASDPAYGRDLTVALEGILDFVGLFEDARLIDVRLPLHPNGFTSIATPQEMQPISTGGVGLGPAIMERQLPGAPPSLDRVVQDLAFNRQQYGLPHGVWPDAIIVAFNDNWTGCRQLDIDLNRSGDLSVSEMGGARILVINDYTGDGVFNSLLHNSHQNGAENAPWHFERCNETFGNYELGYLQLATLGFRTVTGVDFSFSQAFDGFGESWRDGALVSDLDLEQFIEDLRTSTVSDQEGIQQ